LNAERQAHQTGLAHAGYQELDMAC
jgi:hypothetical protein